MSKNDVDEGFMVIIDDTQKIFKELIRLTIRNFPNMTYGVRENGRTILSL